MGKIATNAEVNAKIGSSLSPANKCPTKKEIMNTGLAVIKGQYSDNQCVQLFDVDKSGFIVRFGGTRGTTYWVSQINYPPRNPGLDWTEYSSGTSNEFYEGELIGNSGRESFAFGKTLYVTGSNGYKTMISSDKVVPGGSADVG